MMRAGEIYAALVAAITLALIFGALPARWRRRAPAFGMGLLSGLVVAWLWGVS